MGMPHGADGGYPPALLDGLLGLNGGSSCRVARVQSRGGRSSVARMGDQSPRPFQSGNEATLRKLRTEQGRYERSDRTLLGLLLKYNKKATI